MTEAERDVIKWACNLTEAIVAGSYNLPEPMNIAINMLQDAVWKLSRARGWDSPKDGCGKDFLDEKEKYWKELNEKLKS